MKINIGTILLAGLGIFVCLAVAFAGNGGYVNPVNNLPNLNVVHNLTVGENITGNLVGNTSGQHIGSVIGDVQGNLTGNITGNTTVTGNAQVAGNMTVSGTLTTNGLNVTSAGSPYTTGNFSVGSSDTAQAKLYVNGTAGQNIMRISNSVNSTMFFMDATGYAFIGAMTRPNNIGTDAILELSTTGISPSTAIAPILRLSDKNRNGDKQFFDITYTSAGENSVTFDAYYNSTTNYMYFKPADTTTLSLRKNAAEVTGLINATTTIQAMGGFKASTGTTGITNTTGYWLCSAADCSAKCQVSIDGGIITGCN